MNKKDMVRVGEILERLDPLLERCLRRIIEQDGHMVCVSVCGNIATSLMAMALVTLAEHGGDSTQLIQQLFNETTRKYENARNEILSDLISSGGTCAPLH
jgi:signal transduction protein with GAF and PtsI domain